MFESKYFGNLLSSIFNYQYHEQHFRSHFAAKLILAIKNFGNNELLDKLLYDSVTRSEFNYVGFKEYKTFQFEKLNIKSGSDNGGGGLDVEHTEYFLNVLKMNLSEVYIACEIWRRCIMEIYELFDKSNQKRDGNKMKRLDLMLRDLFVDVNFVRTINIGDLYSTFKKHTYNNNNTNKLDAYHKKLLINYDSNRFKQYCIGVVLQQYNDFIHYLHHHTTLAEREVLRLINTQRKGKHSKLEVLCRRAVNVRLSVQWRVIQDCFKYFKNTHDKLDTINVDIENFDNFYITKYVNNKLMHDVQPNQIGNLIRIYVSNESMVRYADLIIKQQQQQQKVLEPIQKSKLLKLFYSYDNTNNNNHNRVNKIEDHHEYNIPNVVYPFNDKRVENIWNCKYNYFSDNTNTNNDKILEKTLINHLFHNGSSSSNNIIENGGAASLQYYSDRLKCNNDFDAYDDFINNGTIIEDYFNGNDVHETCDVYHPPIRNNLTENEKLKKIQQNEFKHTTEQMRDLLNESIQTTNYVQVYGEGLNRINMDRKTLTQLPLFETPNNYHMKGLNAVYDLCDTLIYLKYTFIDFIDDLKYKRTYNKLCLNLNNSKDNSMPKNNLLETRSYSQTLDIENIYTAISFYKKLISSFYDRNFKNLYNLENFQVQDLILPNGKNLEIYLNVLSVKNCDANENKQIIDLLLAYKEMMTPLYILAYIFYNIVNGFYENRCFPNETMHSFNSESSIYNLIVQNESFLMFFCKDSFVDNLEFRVDKPNNQKLINEPKYCRFFNKSVQRISSILTKILSESYTNLFEIIYPRDDYCTMFL
jgi:hypothetical protein